MTCVFLRAITTCWSPAPSRDDYDKKVKEAKELQLRRHTTTPRRPRRPDIQVYHPRRRRKIQLPLTWVPAVDGAATEWEWREGLCVCLFCRWIRTRGWCWGWGVERERVEHRDWNARDWTLLARLSGRLWCHYVLPCAQGAPPPFIWLYLPFVRFLPLKFCWFNIFSVFVCLLRTISLRW